MKPPDFARASDKTRIKSRLALCPDHYARGRVSYRVYTHSTISEMFSLPLVEFCVSSRFRLLIAFASTPYAYFVLSSRRVCFSHFYDVCQKLEVAVDKFCISARKIG